jgi:hypothetical protein
MQTDAPTSSEELSAWLRERKGGWSALRMAKRRERNALLADSMG